MHTRAPQRAGGWHSRHASRVQVMGCVKGVRLRESDELVVVGDAEEYAAIVVGRALTPRRAVGAFQRATVFVCLRVRLLVCSSDTVLPRRRCRWLATRCPGNTTR